MSTPQELFDAILQSGVEVGEGSTEDPRLGDHDASLKGAELVVTNTGGFGVKITYGNIFNKLTGQIENLTDTLYLARRPTLDPTTDDGKRQIKAVNFCAANLKALGVVPNAYTSPLYFDVEKAAQSIVDAVNVLSNNGHTIKVRVSTNDIGFPRVSFLKQRAKK